MYTSDNLIQEYNITMIEKKFRILSLDGGGVRGYLTTLILENIEKQLHFQDKTQKPLGKYFDLIAGTSTGAIIGGLLAIGKSAKEIRVIYERDIKEIFSNDMKREGKELFLKAKYKKDNLKIKASEYFGDRTFDDVITPLLVTSVDITTMTPRFYKSAYSTKNITRVDEKLSSAIVASASAPAFFPIEESLQHSTNLIDGGIVANNPSLVALIDAFSFEKKPKAEDIILLSVGTGKANEVPYDIDSLKDGSTDWLIQINNQGIEKHLGKKNFLKYCRDIVYSKIGLREEEIQTINPLIEILMNSQSSLAEFQTKFLMNQYQAIYKRINPNLGVKIQLDEADKIEILKNLADLDEDTTIWVLENLKDINVV